MKRLISLLLCLLLVCAAVPAVFANNLLVVSNAKELVVDEAGLLSEEEKADLSQRAQEISQRQDCDVVIVTVNGLGYQTAEEYADDYFDYKGYGTGNDRSGILFLISMEDRDFAISTRGEAINAFTDNALNYIFTQKLRSSLSGNAFYQAFSAFLKASDSMLNVYRGTASDAEMQEYGAFLSNGDPTPRQHNYVGSVIIALILGFLVAYIPMSSLKAQVKNVHKKANATGYHIKDSMHLNVSNDRYLYANTVVRVIQRAPVSSGGGGGGSSTHISSSGATHGGISGKF